MPPTDAMDHTDLLRVVEILEANHRLCTKTIRVSDKAHVYHALRNQIEATDKLITDLKDSITSKVDAQSDVREDSEQQTIIYTPSRTESQNESKHDTFDLDDQTAKPSIAAPQQAIQDKVALLLEKVTSKDDALALLKHVITQKDDSTDSRDEARVIDPVNTKKAAITHNEESSKICLLENNLGFLIDKFASLDVKIGRLGLKYEIDMAKLRTELSDSADHVEKPGLISHEQCNSLKEDIVAAISLLKEDIVAAIKEASIRPVTSMRDKTAAAMRDLDTGYTSASGSSKKSQATAFHRPLELSPCTIKHRKYRYPQRTEMPRNGLSSVITGANNKVEQSRHSSQHESNTITPLELEPSRPPPARAGSDCSYSSQSDCDRYVRSF